MFILQPRTIDMYIYPHLIASGYAACLVCFFSASCHNALDEPESEVRHEEAVLDCRPRTLVASIASDGVLELIVRQERHPDGSLGLGSGVVGADNYQVDKMNL